MPSRPRIAQKRYYSKSKMAAGEKLKFTKKLNNFRTVAPILAKFGMELQLDTAQTAEGSKRFFFSKSKMAAADKMNFTKN